MNKSKDNQRLSKVQSNTSKLKSYRNTRYQKIHSMNKNKHGINIQIKIRRKKRLTKKNKIQCMRSRISKPKSLNFPPNENTASKEVGDRVSIPGFDHLFKRKTSLDMKIYWIIVFSVCIFTCSLQLMKIVMEYTKLEPATEFGLVEKEVAEEIKIPLITLCPRPVFSKQRVGNALGQKYGQTFKEQYFNIISYLQKKTDIFRLPDITAESIYDLGPVKASNVEVEIEVSVNTNILIT